MPKFNINSHVTLVLRDRGKKILAEARWPIPEDGVLREQLWQVMTLFGPHITMGLDPPFETDIVIDKEDLKA